MIHYSCCCCCCCCYLCSRLRLMWWNPHGEMMCSAEGWQSRGEGLAVSEACWTTYMFRTSAPVCQHTDSTNLLCSHYLSEFFSLPPALWQSLQLQTFIPVWFSCLISHIWSLSAVCWSMQVLPLWAVGASGLNVSRGRKNCTNFTALIETSPSPQEDTQYHLKGSLTPAVESYMLNLK